MKKMINPRLIIILIIILALAGVIIGHNIKKENLRQSIIDDRKASAKLIEENLPSVITDKDTYVLNASATVDLVSYNHNFTDYKGHSVYYIQWEDNITFSCSVDDSFNEKSDSAKLLYFKKLTEMIKDESCIIQKDGAPIYDEYYSRGHFINVFEEEVFCRRNTQIILTADTNKYVYNGKSWHVSEAFTQNGVEKDLTPVETTTNNTKTNSNPGKNKKKAKPYYDDYQEYPDCDDYEDYDDFMDDWDDNMPDDLDAEDYWEDW